MVKLVVRICAFFVIFSIILSLLDECEGNNIDKFLTSIFHPSGNKDANSIKDDDILDADPGKLNILVNTQVVNYKVQIENAIKTNLNLIQEIEPVNIEINNYIQSVKYQEVFIQKKGIGQTVLLNWVKENNMALSYLGKKYDELHKKIDQLVKDNERMESQIKSLKRAIENNENLRNADYEVLKAELMAQIEALKLKQNELTAVIENSTSALKKLNNAIDDCIQQISRINKKLDKLIVQSNRSDSQSHAKAEKTYYYIVDTEEELMRKSIVSIGGLYGGMKVNVDLDKSTFKELLETEKSIPLGSDDDGFEVLSAMPPDSYEYRSVNRVRVLVINDLERFWANTSFLVIRKSEKGRRHKNDTRSGRGRRR